MIRRECFMSHVQSIVESQGENTEMKLTTVFLILLFVGMCFCKVLTTRVIYQGPSPTTPKNRKVESGAILDAPHRCKFVDHRGKCRAVSYRNINHKSIKIQRALNF
ncbi:hypothetical protein ACFFRR_001868 [Megaselia abdita]